MFLGLTRNEQCALEAGQKPNRKLATYWLRPLERRAAAALAATNGAYSVRYYWIEARNIAHLLI